MRLNKIFKRILVTVSLVLPAFAAHAWDGVVTGAIIQTDGVGGIGGAPGNYTFRVVLANQPSMCGTGSVDWAYLNGDDANYKGLMSMLLMAQAAGKTVRIFSNKDVSANCQIGYVSILG